MNEEDIKILEEFIKLLKFEPKENPKAFLELHYNFQKEIAQALENLINRNKELEEENKIYALNGDNIKLELHIKNNYIPKSKVEEKIEEIKMTSSQINGDYFMNNYKIDVLQELLEE